MRNAVLVLLLSLPAAAEVDLASGAKLVEARKFEEARTFYEASLAADPANVKAHVALSHLYAEQLDDLEKAVEHGEKAVKLAPSDSAAHMALGEAYALKAVDAGVFSAFSQAKKSKAEMQLAVAKDPKNLEARLGLFQFLLAAPGIVGGGVDDARKLAEETMKVDETTGRRMRAAILRKEKKPAEAEVEIRKALELSPAVADVHAAAGLVYRDAGRLDEAIAEFRKALELDPKEPARHLGIAGTLVQKGAFDEAIGEYQAALQQDPRFVAAHFRLAEALEKKGDKAAAKKSYQQCVALRPKSGTAKEAEKRLKKL